MATTFKPRTDLISADFNDRRRLAMSELEMMHEEGSWTPLVVGQVVLKHVHGTLEVARMGDEIARRLHH
jgi:hypothetical protein